MKKAPNREIGAFSIERAAVRFDVEVFKAGGRIARSVGVTAYEVD
jgi:nuclear transport factor 2 (NTF2) superfamily protein